MKGKCIYKVIKPLPEEEEIEGSESKKTLRVLKKLYIIRHLYRGMSVKKAGGNERKIESPVGLYPRVLKDVFPKFPLDVEDLRKNSKSFKKNYRIYIICKELD